MMPRNLATVRPSFSLMTRLFCLVLSLAAVSVGSGGQVDFDTEVMPVLTRYGCNAGSCHGAAVGRGGFKLSLLGSDAAADHDTITHELAGRRVNLARADRSLILRKPSEQVGHEGGYVLPEESTAFTTLENWIDQGARRLADRSLVNLTVSPQEQKLVIGQSVPMKVIAKFSDSTTVDVTDQTVFVADDPEAVAIDLAKKTITAKRRGVYVVIARFMDRVLPMRLVVPLHDAVPLAATPPTNRGPTTQAPTNNRIDEHVNEQLRQLNLAASPQADDFVFLRRVTLDLTGRLPTQAQSKRFAGDDAADKRSRLIDQLLSGDEYAEYWALKWANVLAIDSKQLQPQGARAYQNWLFERLRDDAPMDETARLMLTTVGDSYVDGAANFSRVGMNAGDLAEHATRVFMGVRMRCANCHNHPLDHWQQDDYHGLAAIFAKVKRGRVVGISARGEVTHPVTGQPAIQRIPGQRFLSAEADGRAEFARWLTSEQSPYLAQVTVNRLWQQLMGRGLVEPVDDIRATNPATHPRLLQWLSRDFVDHGYRLKPTIALICNSAAYQRSAFTVAENAADLTFYSHALSRPLEAEVMADAIGDVTGIRLDIGETDRAVALTDNRFESPSLDILGRCDRSESCTSSADASPSLARSLHLINGPLVNQRLTDPAGRLHRLLATQKDNQKVLDQLYWWSLSRPRHASEKEFWSTQLANTDLRSPDSRAAFFEDALWGLITSDAFGTNH